MALFSDNSPTVSWVRKMAAKGSKVADQLLRAIALRMRLKHISPLTPMHISGEENAMTDIPSRSWGSTEKWHCKTDGELLNLFNLTFPLPTQSSWTVYRPSPGIKSRIISVLRMQVLEMDEWRRLPRPGKHIGETGTPTANLWDWTLSYRKESGETSTSTSKLSWGQSGRGPGDMGVRSEVERFQRRSRPLTRRSVWPQGRSL